MVDRGYRIRNLSFPIPRRKEEKRRVGHVCSTERIGKSVVGFEEKELCSFRSRWGGHHDQVRFGPTWSFFFETDLIAFGKISVGMASE